MLSIGGIKQKGFMVEEATEVGLRHTDYRRLGMGTASA